MADKTSCRPIFVSNLYCLILLNFMCIDRDLLFNTAVFLRTLPTISAQFEGLKPSFQQIDRLESLVARVGQDMDVIEKQLDEAEGTIMEGTLKNVLKKPLNLFSKQLGEVGLGGADEQFVPHQIFSTEKYFGSGNK